MSHFPFDGGVPSHRDSNSPARTERLPSFPPASEAGRARLNSDHFALSVYGHDDRHEEEPDPWVKEAAAQPEESELEGGLAKGEESLEEAAGVLNLKTVISLKRKGNKVSIANGKEEEEKPPRKPASTVNELDLKISRTEEPS